VLGTSVHASTVDLGVVDPLGFNTGLSIIALDGGKLTVNNEPVVVDVQGFGPNAGDEVAPEYQRRVAIEDGGEISRSGNGRIAG